MSDLPYTLVLPEGFVKVPLPGQTAWVTALRSGEYVQGRDPYLCCRDRYCCLGVLSRVQGRLDPSVELPRDGCQFEMLDRDNPCYPILGFLGRLPKGVMVMFKGSPLWRLTQLNDQGMSFVQIADVLEAVYVEADGEGASVGRCAGGSVFEQPLPTSAAEEVRS